MSVVLGKNVFIHSGNSGSTAVIAGAKSCTLSRKCDTMEKASATQNSSKEFIAGRDEWEVTINHLLTSSSPFEGILKVKETYTISIVIEGVRKYGQAICTQADLSGAVGGLAQGSVRFKGTGPLT